MKNFLVILLCLLLASPTLASINIKNGLPETTVVSEMGDAMYVNGVPIKAVAIKVSKSIKEVSSFFYKTWLEQGWTTNLQRHGDTIIVSATNRKYLKTVNLVKSGEFVTEGSISLTDLPHRMQAGIGPDYAVGEHLPKPLNSTVLNEVKVRDAKGESIMTTIANNYDEEQNINFYRIQMKERGWNERKFSRPSNGRNGILIFEKDKKEANFTILRDGKQVFVTVNFLSP